MPDEPKEFDIRTNAEWQKLGWSAESISKVRVVAAEVPPEFQHLIPYVEKWAISCDVRRGDFYDKQTKADRLAFHQAIAPFEHELNRWVDSPPLKGAKRHFLIMLKAYGEVGCEIAYDQRQFKKTNPDLS